MLLPGQCAPQNRIVRNKNILWRVIMRRYCCKTLIWTNKKSLRRMKVPMSIQGKLYRLMGWESADLEWI